MRPLRPDLLNPAPTPEPTRAAQTARRVRTAFRDSEALALEDLASWVNHDSPSGDPIALASLAGMIADRLTAYGATPRLEDTPGGQLLRATVEGTGSARVVLLCHHDTVFPTGTATARPFCVSGDRARGPGVADMKGGIALAVHLLRLLPGIDPASFHQLELVCVPDEEVRTTSFPGCDALGDRTAVLCLECGRPGNGVVTQRKAGLWLAVRVAGQAAHAGVAPHSGRSALLAACTEALRIATFDDLRPGLSANITTLHSGESLNSVAATATMDIDLRAWTTADLDWAERQVRQFGDHPDIHIAVTGVDRTPPLERTPSVANLAQTAGKIAAALGTPIHEVATGGASDASWAAALNIPTLDGLGPIGADDHTPDEYIEIASLGDRAGLLAGIITAINES